MNLGNSPGFAFQKEERGRNGLSPDGKFCNLRKTSSFLVCSALRGPVVDTGFSF